jgi:hypothetical protein
MGTLTARSEGMRTVIAYGEFAAEYGFNYAGIDFEAEFKIEIRSRKEERRFLVYVRVVRFTDVTAERVEGLLARVEESGGPPPGVPATGLQVLFDEGQGTAVVLQLFDSAEDMRTGGEAFAAMDPSETPGTRVSVDMCEMKLERHV